MKKEKLNIDIQKLKEPIPFFEFEEANFGLELPDIQFELPEIDFKMDFDFNFKTPDIELKLPDITFPDTIKKPSREL